MTSESRSADSSIVCEQLGAFGVAPVHVVLAKARGGGLDAGQRGSQVVADGGQQPGPDAVGLGERVGPGGLIGQFLTLPGPCGEVGQGREQVPVLADELGAPCDELQATGGGSAQGRFARVSPPTDARRMRRPATPWRRATASMANSAWTRSRTVVTDPSPISTVPSSDSSRDSTECRSAACRARAPSSTAMLTRTATRTKTTRSTAVSRFATASV